MGSKTKILDVVKNPLLIVPILGYRGFFHWMPDELYLKLVFRAKVGCWPNLKNPRTYNEKLQWLKLHNKNPLYTKLVDKYEVKKLIADLIGEEYIIPTLGVWDKFDDIDFDNLPRQFVLKCTHDSGGLVICKDKTNLDIAAAKKKIEACLKKNFFWGTREWPYKYVKPRIIAETYMEDGSGNELTDYKFFCFNGVPRIMYVSHDIAKNATTDFFDMDYVRLPIRMRDPNSEQIPPKEPLFEKLKELSKILCQDYPHVRTDFYVVSDKIFFGEMTFYHNSGFSAVHPHEWNVKMGDMIEINV